MQPSLSQELTAQFYDWEQLGRGWLYADAPIYLEPPFVPFYYHTKPHSAPVKDDGKRHTIFSFVAEKVQQALRPKQVIQEEEPIFLDPIPFDCDEPLQTFTISLPKGHVVKMANMESLLIVLSDSRYPISFEIITSENTATLQLACYGTDAPLVASQIKAYFPACTIKETADPIIAICSSDTGFAAIDYYGLRDEFTRPICMTTTFDPDPFIGLFAALEHLQQGQSIIIQVLFQGTQYPWAESIIRSVSDSEGKPFFENAPEMLPLAKEKISSPLYAVSMRVATVAESMEEATYLAQYIQKPFGRLFFSESNSIIPIHPDISFMDRLRDFIRRESHVLGMLLNTEELANIVHLPSESLHSEQLVRERRKTKQAPKITEGHSFILGVNEHQGREKNVSIQAAQRLRHTHIIGATGTGKSTLIQSMVVQDMQLGNGIAILDPHGQLIEDVLPHIPEHRRKDVCIIDPSDRDYPIGFNFCTAHSETEKDILSSDLVAVFKRLSTSWGDQMNAVLANAILALLESSTGGTLADLRRFLIEKPFREKFLQTVSDPNIRYYWQKEYPLLKTNSIGPILTRLDTFLRPKLIRNMVAQNKSLDFEHLLDTQKILLVKLSQGLIGTENSYLLGTVIVSKIHQAAMARQAKEDRKDFFVYIDEFQHFITPSMSHILSGARKYHVGLILAHQDMQQLTKYDSELASAVVANAGTRICFRLGDTDARRFDSGFSSFDAKDLESLNTGEAICRIDRPDYDFSLSTIPLPEIEHQAAEAIKEAVINLSRQQYATPRAAVEKLLQEETKEPQAEKEAVHIPTPTTPKQVTPQQQVPELKEEDIQKTKAALVQQHTDTLHRSLQLRIKKMAEQRGYKATIEAATPDGKGKVDVLLERNSKRIACEVCVTTGSDWEVHNIQKCIDAGYELIVECSQDKKTLQAIKDTVEKVFEEQIRNTILILEPEQLFTYLDSEIAKEATTETRVRGYRVKVEYSAEPSGTDSKRQAVSKAIADAARKSGKK